MIRGSEQFQAVERAWRKRVENARERYLAAAGQAADSELKRSVKVEYLRVLRVFTDLVIKGKMPPEEE
jgi:hypothetical protein